MEHLGRRLIPFTIDGQPFETSDLSQRARRFSAWPDWIL